jgi:hypothetical protein
LRREAIYRFKSYDIANDEIKTSRRWGTKAAIEEVGGQPFPETAVEVDSSILGGEVIGMTERDWWPPKHDYLEKRLRRYESGYWIDPNKVD